ncbi:hypothetical protein AALA83_13730 [Oscillospiraceae bacterium 44-5]
MQNNLLVGNGINIQFNRTDYTTQQIVLRILKNFDRDDFPSHIIADFPYLMKNYIGFLFLESREIISGKYDKFAVSSAEKGSLVAFKKQYSAQINSLRITDIGFEDYYLIHDLECHKTGTQNPDQFYIREGMKVAYLYSIFNDGKLNQLYQDYPPAFIEYLMQFENIFTTNYDSNIESAIEKEIFHIHGQFDKKSEVYIADSFRNQLPDSPICDIIVDEKFYYLYSNALTTHCGAYKEFQLKQYSQANSCVEKMATAYKTDAKAKEEIDRWTYEDNPLTANLGYAIQLKAANPSLAFSDDYHFEQFKAMAGTLEILGLSPWNDFHIFETIDSASLESCTYYFFNKSECDMIKSLLLNLDVQGKLSFKSVKLFWEQFYEK